MSAIALKTAVEVFMRINCSNIGKRKRKLKEMREELESTQLNSIRQLLTNEVIDSICQSSQYDFRKRFLTPQVTILHMLSAAYSRETSFEEEKVPGTAEGDRQRD